MQFWKLSQAVLYAVMAHKWQKRRGGEAYVQHPMRVSLNFAWEMHLTVCSLLHDVVEDTDNTIETIYEIFWEEVADTVAILTNIEWEGYGKYIRYLSEFDDARIIKIFDMIDNLMDNPTERQIKKYKEYLPLLLKKQYESETSYPFPELPEGTPARVQWAVSDMGSGKIQDQWGDSDGEESSFRDRFRRGRRINLNW